jgi:plastocyanin
LQAGIRIHEVVAAIDVDSCAVARREGAGYPRNAMRPAKAFVGIVCVVLLATAAGRAHAQDFKREPDPVADKIAAFKEAATNLERAQQMRGRGNKSQAEQFFSTAEILVGPEALADLAPLFREGGPPRVTTPLKQFPADAKPQPEVVGGSDEDEPEAKPAKGSLAGTMQIDGKAGGAIGIVTLEPIGKKWKKRTPKVRVVEQRDRNFAPHVLAVPVGSTVTFPNFDQVFHNVFSVSEAQKFDLGLYKGGQAREMVFEKEGIVRLGCNLHANMSAYVVVVGAPHYAVADASGGFRFKSLEPGKYTLRAWSEKSLAPVTQEITIASGDNKVNVGVKADAPQGPAPDKFGVPRGKKP